jgi:hypothetical protein
MPGSAVSAKTRVPPHVFVADPDLPPHPADLEQRSVCATCHLLGAPGDAHHQLPPAVEDGRMRAAGDTGGA